LGGGSFTLVTKGKKAVDNKAKIQEEKQGKNMSYWTRRKMERTKK